MALRANELAVIILARCLVCFTGRAANWSQRHLITRSARAALAAVALTALAGCSTIATHDRLAYEKATAAKAEALVLMDKATEPYSAHRAEAETVALTIEKAYQYDLGRGKNEETIRQWEILKNPDGNLFGGFLRRWKRKGAFKPDAITLKRPDIASAFDQIIILEGGKPRSKL